MALDFPSTFSDAVKAHLRRSQWGNFPDVIIHAEESIVKKHRLYAAAKSGDAIAAEGLVLETSPIEALDRICAIIGDRTPYLLAVHAQESQGANVIPRAMARLLSRMLSLPWSKSVIQINRVSHTGADGYHRLSSPPLFAGEVELDDYFLVDDFIGQGGTLANLKGFLESCGASVIGATALTGKAYSAKLALTDETLQKLRGKYGNELENWWCAAFGYGFECLTESEARYLTRADDADTIRTRIAAASRRRS